MKRKKKWVTYQHNHMNLERVSVVGGFHTQEHKYSLRDMNTEQAVHRSQNHRQDVLHNENTHTAANTHKIFLVKGKKGKVSLQSAAHGRVELHCLKEERRRKGKDNNK